MVRHADGKTLASHPLVGYSRQSHAIPTPPIPLPNISDDKRPLAGIKVIELVRIIAGPVIGSTLAAFGADVIRVNCSRLVDLNVCREFWPSNFFILTDNVYRLYNLP